MTKINCGYELFKASPEQEIFGNLMLQYDLSKCSEDRTLIPFQIIEWCGCNGNDDEWNERNTEIDLILEGDIIFEGIRHCNFAPQDDGYVNYPNIKSLSLALGRLHDLCLKYCHSYD